MEVYRKIPKIVHQTYANLSDLSPEIIDKNRKLESLNPEYTFEYYDDSRVAEWITKNCDVEQRELFWRINPKYGAARADLFRYLLIYREGGIYLDVKSTCLIPFDELINHTDEFLVSKWELDPLSNRRKYGRHRELQEIDTDEFQQWFLISKPFNPVILALVNQVNSNLKCPKGFFHSDFGRNGVLRLTGPIVFSKVISQSLEFAVHREIDSFSLGLRYKTVMENAQVIYKNKSNKHYSKLYDPIVLEGSIFRNICKKCLNFLLFQWIDRLELFHYQILQKIKRLIHE